MKYLIGTILFIPFYICALLSVCFTGLGNILSEISDRANRSSFYNWFS